MRQLEVFHPAAILAAALVVMIMMALYINAPQLFDTLSYALFALVIMLAALGIAGMIIKVKYS